MGFGLILNGEMFTGENGMAADYGLSFCEWGIWEDKISLKYLRSEIEKIYGERVSPRDVQKDALDGDSRAQNLFNHFGENVGLALSHVINMLDPAIISIGGGLSNAFDCFKDSMFASIEKHSPTFLHNKINIEPSNLKEKSTMLGACVYVKHKKNN